MSNIVDSDFSYPFTIANTAGVAQDVSTWTFETQWLDSATRKNIFTLTDGVEFVSDGTDGECKLVLTAAQTKQLCAGMKRVVIWRTDSSLRVVIGEGSAAFESIGFDAR